jgi:hypothetical protein
MEKGYRAAGKLDQAQQVRGLAELWEDQTRYYFWKWMMALLFDEP